MNVVKQKKNHLKSSLFLAGSALALIISAPLQANDGAAVYAKVCKTCHGAGVMGAPKLGDSADWGERAKQGVSTLEEHALKGFKGKKGFMPPKGGRSSLSDDEVKAALAHMLDSSK